MEETEERIGGSRVHSPRKYGVGSSATAPASDLNSLYKNERPLCPSPALRVSNGS